MGRARGRSQALASRVFGWALVIALTAAGLIAIIAIATGDLDDTAARVLSVSIVFTVYAWSAARGLSVADGGTPAEQALGAAVVIASAVAFGLAVNAIWTDSDESNAYAIAAAAGILALGLTHLALTAPVRGADGDRAPLRVLSWASVVSIQAAAILSVLLILEEVEDTDATYRVTFVLFVLGVLLTLLIPLLRRLTRAKAREG